MWLYIRNHYYLIPMTSYSIWQHWLYWTHHIISLQSTSMPKHNQDWSSNITLSFLKLITLCSIPNNTIQSNRMLYIVRCLIPQPVWNVLLLWNTLSNECDIVSQFSSWLSNSSHQYSKLSESIIDSSRDLLESNI